MIQSSALSLFFFKIFRNYLGHMRETQTYMACNPLHITHRRYLSGSGPTTRAECMSWKARVRLNIETYTFGFFLVCTGADELLSLGGFVKQHGLQTGDIFIIYKSSESEKLVRRS